MSLIWKANLELRNLSGWESTRVGEHMESTSSLLRGAVQVPLNTQAKPDAGSVLGLKEQCPRCWELGELGSCTDSDEKPAVFLTLLLYL